MNSRSSVRRVNSIIGALFFLLVATIPQAATIYVPKDYPRIKDAARAAHDGDEIIVAPGIYKERVGFGGRNIIIRSTFDGDWSIIQNTIIDSSSVGANVIGFTGTETSQCTLRGFTIRNGIGGIIGQGTHATIEYNIFAYNRNVHGLFGVMRNGGAIDGCNGLIQNNIFRYNQANYGGALAVATARSRITSSTRT